MSAAELTEAADFLEANGWLPTTLGTPAVEAIAAPLLPGDKGRIVAALREAAAGAHRVALSAEDQQAARDLWVGLGRHEMAHATPEQLLQFMRRCPDTVGVDLAAKMLASQERAARCSIADHAGRLEHAEAQLAAMPAALATAREEGRDSVGLADFMPDPCGEEKAAPNWHFVETYGDWLPCSRQGGHDGEHEHEDSGLTWPRDDKEPRP